MADHLTVHAPAKTNLFLAIGEVQDHGYHAVRTVLCPLDLHDVLVLSSTKGASSLSCKGDQDMSLPPIAVEENLVMRALRAMQEAFDRTDGFDITLEKHIPSGAGLGGGSSDAAATIVALAHFWGIDPRGEKALAVARSLGADVPFFLYGGASCMDGRGDHLIRSYEMPRIEVVLVKPDQPVPTAQAYTLFDEIGVIDGHEEACHYADLIYALEEGRPEDIPVAIYNNMTPISERIVPAIADILAYEQEVPGISRAFVSGSGSAVAILCKDKNVAISVLERAERDGYWAARTFTRNEGVAIVREDDE